MAKDIEEGETVLFSAGVGRFKGVVESIVDGVATIRREDGEIRKRRVEVLTRARGKKATVMAGDPPMEPVA